MTKYRVFKDGDKYYPQHRWFYIWLNMTDIDGGIIVCNSEVEAQTIINEDKWVEDNFI